MLIKGKTLVKRDVVDSPKGVKVLRTINANTEILATENDYQWLHLIGGGWVNAGPQQQYIKWQVTSETTVPPSTPPVQPPPPPQPAIPNPVTEIKRQGRIATLLVDWQNPKWGYNTRNVGQLNAYPQTVTFSHVCDYRKGTRIPLTEPVLEYLRKLNGDRIKEQILIPSAGWINNPTVPPTVERLSWAANHVVVKETRVQFDVEYSNIYASNCYATDLQGTFFDKDMRLIVHKFNAFTQKKTMIKLGSGRDCYTPFITDPNVMNGDMWIRSDWLEMWPELPFTLSDGSSIIEYELYGFQIFGRRADGSTVLLRDSKGFKTNWKINSPELPI